MCEQSANLSGFVVIFNLDKNSPAYEYESASKI